ncbi:phenol hydroxylase subunit P4 [Sphingobium sp. SA916]|uniref:phenol hydroxylase subunit P4 n=1 Tax=Sphingobium sp. SA916 TaxID=1851207 RepID=UPI000C9EF5BD|nr:phenol hydroxylase subunit P4 [Sphingobium sp. SA916]PNQ04509.1 phenol hydroxylase [Sphingobium sp. SA916]
MAVKAIDTYEFEPADKAENFHGARLVYAGWDGHLLFSSPYAWPLPPDLPFAHFIAGPMAEIFGQHPDWAGIDWDSAVWTRNGEAFAPDMQASIAANGLSHKDALRFRTPGRDGLNGAGI